MKLVESEGEVERFGIAAENNFRIKATGKAFRALSDTLYSDKPLAIVRELSANAYDSHAAAGNLDKPFLIHAPNALEPHFSIRDYGVGLTPQEIQEVYTTYFESTKTNSNDYVGCLGLGSKTPFAYNDQFTITSYRDGVAYQYSAYMNEEDVPTIALLDTSRTKEPNGLEIQVAIKRDDYKVFVQKIHDVFTYYKVKPEVQGAQVAFKEVKYTMSGSEYGIREPDSAGAYAVMGNISYPIPANFYDKLDALQRAVLQLDINIFFNIGELEVTLSREKLSFKPKVVDLILERINKIAADVTAQIELDISSSDSLWTASIVAKEKYRSTIFSSIFNILSNQKTVKWNGKALLNSHVQLSGKDTEITKFYCARKRGAYYGERQPKHTVGESTVAISSNSRFFINDLARGAHNRLNEELKKEIANKKTESEYYLLVFKTPAARAEFVKECGILDSMIEVVSKIDKPVRAASTRTKVAQVFEHSFSSNYTSTANWRDKTIDLTLGGIYVPLQRFEVVLDEKAKRIDFVRDVADALKDLGSPLPSPVYGMRAIAMKQIKDEPKWVSLDVYVKKVIDSKLQQLASKDDFNVYLNNKHSGGTHKRFTKVLSGPIVKKGIHKDSKFAEHHNSLLKIDTIMEKADLESLADLINLIGYDYKSSNQTTYESIINEIVVKYPMFKMGNDVGEYYLKNYVDLYTDYVRMIDSAEGKNFPTATLTNP
jgi:hypothetical protein